MKLHPNLAISVLAVTLGASLAPSTVVAQEKQHVSFSTPAQNTKYTEKTENIDIGDVPNHVWRVFEIQRTYSTNAPVINGTKMIESWTRGVGDRIDGTGTNLQYVVFTMENGDKIFARMEGTAINEAGKVTVMIAGRLTGGTGKLERIKGLVKEIVDVDPKTNKNENRTEIEYYLDK
jgi:hypothetical protein